MNCAFCKKEFTPNPTSLKYFNRGKTKNLFCNRTCNGFFHRKKPDGERMRNPSDKIPRTIRFTADTLKKLEQAAISKDYPVSVLAEIIIRDWLSERYHKHGPDPEYVQSCLNREENNKASPQ